MWFPLSHKFSLPQVVSKVSVRGRIAAIAVIPVVGFLANGMAFTAGETQVGNAFESVRSAAALADTGREFKAALARMQTVSKDFVAQPSDEEVAAFDAGHERASSSLDSIAAEIAEGVHRASSEAQGGAEAMGRVAGASKDARAAAADVKSLADTLSVEAESLNAEVHRFLADVQAA